MNSRVPGRNRRILAGAAVGVAALTSHSMAALDATYTGNAGDGQFANGNNWLNNDPAAVDPFIFQPPSADGFGVFANGGNGVTTLTIDPGRQVSGLRFTTGTVSYTIGSEGLNGGNAITLGNSTVNGGMLELAAAATGTNLIEQSTRRSSSVPAATRSPTTTPRRRTGS